MKQPRSVTAVIVFVLAALVLTVSGCSLDGKAKEYRDPSVLIEVEKDQEFAIVLDSNPTTGYQWKLAEPLEAEIVVLVKTEYKAPDAELLGAGGEEKWIFKAEGLGDTSITLAYVRPWEDEDDMPPLMEKEEEEDEGDEADEEEVEEPPDGGTAADTGEAVIDEGKGPDTVTFNVRVKKKGSMDKDPKEYDSDEEEIEVEVGHKFALLLHSNPTTGYSWRLARPLDEDKVILVSSEFEIKGKGGHGGHGEEEEGEEKVGAPGEEVWTFEAVGEGNTEIDLEYVRSWETGVAPEDTKTFKVKISPAHEGESGGH